MNALRNLSFYHEKISKCIWKIIYVPETRCFFGPFTVWNVTVDHNDRHPPSIQGHRLDGGPYTIWREKSPCVIVYTTVAWTRGVSGSIQVLLSKFKKLFFKWNPLKVQKLPFLYWPLETTDPVHTIKSEQCWNLLLLLANVSQKIILKENLYSLNNKYWKYKIFITRSRIGSESGKKISKTLILGKNELFPNF